ncbi:MAG TPA: cardiolipin synthase [Pseudoxanthomonas sp.]|nr:cardiolipin synthase [Pseudoxanthomonas sp.]
MPWTVIFTIVVTVVAVVLAMNFSTPEKKIQQEVMHRHAVADPEFRREMSVMLGPAIIGGNRVDAMQNGDEIFPAMLETIRSAGVSINFETYIYWSGEIGRKFSEALSEKARAGIPVNLVVDWAGSLKMDDELLEEMKDAGVNIQKYRPLRWYTLSRINNRTHRKLLIVDGRIGFTGGVGVADQWLGRAQDADHWRDSHFKLEGPAVAQFQAAFNDNWIKTTGTVLNGPKYFPELQPKGDVPAHLFIASPAGGSESMHLMYLMGLAAAKESIDLVSAYFVPDKLIVKALKEARKRGVRVRVILPGVHIDAFSVRYASKAGWGELLLAGIEIHEYQPTMLHTKMLVVDRELVSVGSTNFDIRSFRLNDEASLNLYDRRFAQRMSEVFESDLRRAKQYNYEMWQARPLKDKLLERFIIPFKSQL